MKKYFTVTLEVSTEAKAEYRIEVSHALAEKIWQAGDDFFIFHSASPVNSGKSTIRWRNPLPLNDPTSPSNTYLRLKIKDKTIQP
ncbi:MAG: hypothetical protein GWO81_01845 [Verrucomicrobia bacterium]|nr:hypothetical protein [Verrucomicrobiota bacterium]